MNLDYSALWEKTQAMANGFLALLPNMVLAILVFLLFFFVARGIRSAVKRLTQRRRQTRNLGLVLGRLAQGSTVLVGLFVALSMICPSPLSRFCSTTKPRKPTAIAPVSEKAGLPKMAKHPSRAAWVAGVLGQSAVRGQRAIGSGVLTIKVIRVSAALKLSSSRPLHETP